MRERTLSLAVARGRPGGGTTCRPRSCSSRRWSPGSRRRRPAARRTARGTPRRTDSAQRLARRGCCTRRRPAARRTWRRPARRTAARRAGARARRTRPRRARARPSRRSGRPRAATPRPCRMPRCSCSTRPPAPPSAASSNPGDRCTGCTGMHRSALQRQAARGACRDAYEAATAGGGWRAFQTNCTHGAMLHGRDSIGAGRPAHAAAPSGRPAPPMQRAARSAAPPPQRALQGAHGPSAQ